MEYIFNIIYYFCLFPVVVLIFYSLWALIIWIITEGDK